MTPTLTRERKPTVRPRKAPGAVFQTHVITHAAETVEVPVKRRVTVKPIRTPLYKREDFWLGVSAIVATVALVWRFG